MGGIASRMFSKKPKHAPAKPSAADENRVKEMERRAAEDARRVAELEREAYQERSYREQQRLLEEARRLEEEVADKNQEIDDLREQHEQQKRDYIAYPLPEFLANAFYEHTVNICVTGNSGAGKSSLINAIRGLHASDRHAARVGVTETTKKAKAYPFPENENVRLWDLPGAGTLRFPAQRYVQQFGLRHFDVVIIASNVRFTELDYEIMDGLIHFGVPFFVVRTKIDDDVRNDYYDHRRSEYETLQNIRIEAQKNGVEELYFVNNRDPAAYDMPTLLHNLEAMIENRDSGFEQREVPSYSGYDHGNNQYEQYGRSPYHQEHDFGSYNYTHGPATSCARMTGFDEETVDTYDDGNISPRSIDTGFDTINSVNTTRTVNTINTSATKASLFSRSLPRFSGSIPGFRRK